MTDPTKTLLDLIAADERQHPILRKVCAEQSALRPNERREECPLCRGLGSVGVMDSLNHGHTVASDRCLCCAGRGYIVMERNDESYIAPSDERNFGWY